MPPIAPEGISAALGLVELVTFAEGGALVGGIDRGTEAGLQET